MTFDCFAGLVDEEPVQGHRSLTVKFHSFVFGWLSCGLVEIALDLNIKSAVHCQFHLLGC